LDFQQKNIIPNGKHGVGIYNGAQRNEVGHVTIPDSTNYIFGNGWSGVVVVNVGSDNNIIAYNHIFENDYYGVAIVDAGGNTIYRNTIWHNGNTSGAGVFVDGSTAVNNRIQQNSIYDSFGLGIELTNGGNTQLSAPTIHQADCEYIAGTACAGCTVEIFSSDDDEGKLFEYTLTANSVSGDFEWGGWLNGPFVTVTADSGNNTSQFSAPFSIGGCTRIFMPLVIASP